MEGNYQFTRDTGEAFDVVIGRFYLAAGKRG
jgi:hypothetical protein